MTGKHAPQGYEGGNMLWGASGVIGLPLGKDPGVYITLVTISIYINLQNICIHDSKLDIRF